MTLSRLLPTNALVASCIALAWPAAALAQVHKVIGPDGTVTYSDKPPDSNQGAKATVLPGRVAGAAAAGDAPKLRHGLWEFRRSFVIDGANKDITSRNCTDPVSTMSFWQKSMTKIGCTYEDTRRSGNRYTQASTCKVEALAMDRRYMKTLEVSGEEAYVLEESASGGNQPPMSSITRARRLGDC
ncbi:DUF3617 domain-containing protein [Hydrogenophaga luteola]|uniref:DUF3617 domain-containing protein n=1 Tax=Hydrogenophaga luteola TaxID=1591122 RepID=A0ABV7W2V9_9BURK